MDPFRVWETDSKGGCFGGAFKNAPETRPFCAQGRRSQELQVVGVCGLCVCVFGRGAGLDVPLEVRING